MQQRSNISTIALIGVMSALVYGATYALNFPVPGGVFHLGDGVVFLAAILFGPKIAGWSGAIGMGLFDLLSPYIIYAPYTFVIKGVMGLIAGTIAWGLGRNGKNMATNIIGVALGGAWMVFGYWVVKAYMIANTIHIPASAFAAAFVAAVPYDVLQVIGGAIVGIPIARALKRTRYFGA